jgi:hypothetical protein
LSPSSSSTIDVEADDTLPEPTLRAVVLTGAGKGE